MTHAKIHGGLQSVMGLPIEKPAFASMVVIPVLVTDLTSRASST